MWPNKLFQICLHGLGGGIVLFFIFSYFYHVASFLDIIVWMNKVLRKIRTKQPALLIALSSEFKVSGLEAKMFHVLI